MDVTGEDIWTVAQTCYGEARGEIYQGIRAVAHVIKNRASKKGTSPTQECRRPYQFSCWNKGDPNLSIILKINVDDKTFRDCLGIAIQVLSEELEDITLGSTHYHTKSVFPYWANDRKPCFICGNHLFYNDID